VDEIIELILRRRIIRFYKSQEVEREKLILLLKVAMAAPNACNNQPWEFLVVTDNNILKQIQTTLYSGHYYARD
jgi:nitroreductase